jgi:uncharacterized protein
MIRVEDILRVLHLQPHPIEGGFFRETYRSKETFPAGALGIHFGPRSVCTAIYYLLTPETVSEMHLLPTDEIFHFYLGDPVEMLQLWPDGSIKRLRLGTDLLNGAIPQTVVPGGVWQGSHLIPGGTFALLGATMAPGFDYADYVRGRRIDLIDRFTEVSDLIVKLTPADR